jgi:O-antigen/teichoic acid export membrane protein
LLPLLAWIQIAGAVQLAISLANLPLASRLQYRKNLAGASEIVRQVFYVHAAYIVLVVLGFAALSLLFPDELVSGRPLGRFLSTFLAVFWLLRVPIQLFYYPVEIRRQNRLADVIFTVAFAFLAIVFGLAATR